MIHKEKCTNLSTLFFHLHDETVDLVTSLVEVLGCSSTLLLSSNHYRLQLRSRFSAFVPWKSHTLQTEKSPIHLIVKSFLVPAMSPFLRSDHVLSALLINI